MYAKVPLHGKYSWGLFVNSSRRPFFSAWTYNTAKRNTFNQKKQETLIRNHHFPCTSFTNLISLTSLETRCLPWLVPLMQVGCTRYIIPKLVDSREVVTHSCYVFAATCRSKSSSTTTYYVCTCVFQSLSELCTSYSFSFLEGKLFEWINFDRTFTSRMWPSLNKFWF